MIKKILCCILGIGLSWNASSQVTEHDFITFNSGMQGMFDPSYATDPYTINEYFSLPFSGPFTWSESASLGDSWSTGSLDLGPFGSFGGFSFGAEFSLATWGKIGFEFEIADFTDGQVLVNYPVDIATVRPSDNSFGYGDPVSLNSDYALQTGYALNTFYPDSGRVESNIYFDVNLDMDATASLGPLSYTYEFVDVHENYSTNLFKISKYDTSYYWGEFDPNPLMGFAPGYPDPSTYAFTSCGDLVGLVDGYCQLGQVYVTDPSIPVSGSFGVLDGELTIPHVITEDVTYGAANTFGPALNKNLSATGDSTYIAMEMDIFKMVSAIISNKCGTGVADGDPAGTPNAGCVKAELILGNLSNSISQAIPGLQNDLEVWYNLLSLRFEVELTNKQEFTFEPTIFGRYEFPTPVSYTVDNAAGTQTQSGTSNVINYTVGDDVNFDYPCFYDDLKIASSYSIEGEFTSHTYDEMDFSIVMDGLGAGVSIPGFSIIPAYNWDICIPYGYPCGSAFWPSWCTGEVCTSFSTPSVSFPDISFNTCSVWSALGSTPGTSLGDYDPSTCSIVIFDQSLASFDFEWHKRTWNLEGFNPIYPADTIVLRGNRMSAAPIAVNHVDCYDGADGTITMQINNGASPFAITWSNGVTQTSTTQTFVSPNFEAGNYIATIIDANGCQTTSGATIMEPTGPLSVTGQITDVNCFGNSTGAIDVSVAGGTESYTFAWTGTTTAASEDLTSIPNGLYNLTVTDSNNCTVSSSYTVNEPGNLTDTLVQLTDVDCFGASTGSIEFEMTGGTSPYTYSWAPSGQTSEDIFNLSSGTYSVTIQDVNSCTINRSYTIDQPTDIIASGSASPVDCFGNNSGSIALTVNGGTPAYTMTWYNQQGQLMSNTGLNAANLFAGAYSVNIEDQNGCTEQVAVTVVEPTAVIEVSASVTNILCFGAGSGAIDVTLSGGTAPYTYDWSNDGTGDNDDPEDLVGLTAGTYNLTVIDGNNCSYTFSYTLTEPSAPISATAEITDVLCFGELTGAIDVTIDGGTTPYTFLWSSGNTTEDITGVVAGGYDLTITDANGCSFVLNSTVNQPAAALALTETHTDVLCHDGSSGTIDVTTIGGTTPYAYEWSDDASTLLTAVTEDLSNLSEGTYLVDVIDNNQCEAQLSITIGEPLAPIALSVITTDALCNGEASGTIDLSVTGGTIGYTFDWDNDGTGDNDDTEDLTGLLAGTYLVNVIDANGCSETITAVIGEPLAPLSGSVFTEGAKCFGEATGSVDLTVFGGTLPYTYSWSNGEVTEDIDLVTSGTYTVDVTDENGCLLTVGGFVSEPSNPLDVVTTVIQPSCFEYSDGSIELTITGGTTPYTVQWGNQNEIILNNPSELLGGIEDGEYLFVVTDRNNCVEELLVTVDQPDTLDIASVVQDVSCFDGTDGEIDVTVTGGTMPYDYAWSNTATTEDLTGLTANEYGLTLTDDNGCVFEETITVDQASEILITSEIAELSCIDQSDGAIYVQTVGGTMPYDWLWSNGEFTESIENLEGGQYQLTITDDYGCQRSFDFIIAETNAECLVIPNTFTPNGDNYNDTWILENMDLYPDAEINVFNKWGNLIHQSKGAYTPWDGTHLENDLPAEVYYYIIRLNNGLNNQYTGTITIVR